MVAYTKVDDSLFRTILHSSEPELEEARQILQNVERRRLYRFIGQTNPKAGREDVMVATLLPVLFLSCISVWTHDIDRGILSVRHVLE